jgi:tripartite ATP-independent transporter DctP family solute receptor
MFRVVAVFLAAGLLAACGSGSSSAAAPSSVNPAQVVLQIGYENNPGEPIDLAMNRWKELVAEKNEGLRIELYPSSQLGSKNEIIDQLIAGDSVGTICDGSFLSDRGVPDLGIMYGPYLFDTWDDCWNLIHSDWFIQQRKLSEDKGIKILTANWIYGERHTLTTKPVRSVKDIKGLKIRVPNNTIQVKGFEVLGAAPTPMPLGEVYTSLQQGTIDGLENPLPVLYNGKFHEVAKYLILDGHIKHDTAWVCGMKFWNERTPKQQEILLATGDEAGLYNNKLQEESVESTIKLFQAEGVTVFDPDPATREEFRKVSQVFYSLPEITASWSANLYETVKKAMKK